MNCLPDADLGLLVLNYSELTILVGLAFAGGFALHRYLVRLYKKDFSQQ